MIERKECGPVCNSCWPAEMCQLRSNKESCWLWADPEQSWGSSNHYESVDRSVSVLLPPEFMLCCSSSYFCSKLIQNTLMRNEGMVHNNTILTVGFNTQWDSGASPRPYPQGECNVQIWHIREMEHAYGAWTYTYTWTDDKCMCHINIRPMHTLASHSHYFSS